MDTGSIALMIPIAAIVSGALVKMAKIRAQSGMGGSAEDIHRRLDAMEQEHANLRQELSEAHERLDFTERLLAQQKDSSLPPKS